MILGTKMIYRPNTKKRK